MAEPRATLENWRSAPHSRWAFHHVRELIPTADIPNDVNAMVIAKLSSQAVSLDAERMALTMRAVAQLRDRLAGA